MGQSILTIGHSTHTHEAFLTLLRQHEISVLCDVRSVPNSRFNPQFNRNNIQETLLHAGINYVFLGRELGARSDDPKCYENGKVKYDRLAQTELFHSGLERLTAGLAQGFRISLMCAEGDPLDCHRSILIARHLTGLGIPVQHIHSDGSLETQEQAIQRLVRQLHVPEAHMFRSDEDVFADAYRLQEARIAYERGDAPEPGSPTRWGALG